MENSQTRQHEAVAVARKQEVPSAGNDGRFRTTFERASVGLAHLGLAGEWLEVNERLCRITGYSHAELLNLRLEDILHPDDLEANATITRDLLSNEVDVYSVEQRLCRPDGKTVWVNVTASIVRNEDRARQYLIAAIQDISAQKEAEQKLKKSDRELRTVLDTLPVGVCFTDSYGRIVMSNHAAAKIWGHALSGGGDQFRNTKARWADSGKSIPAYQSPLTKALKNGESTLGDVVEIETRDGQRKTIYNSAVPIRDETGKIVAAILVNEDITEWRRAELALRETAERLQLATSTVGIGNFEWEFSSDRLVWSEEQYRIFGIPPDLPVTFREWRQAVHADDRLRVETELRSAIHHRRLIELEYRITRGAEVRWISTRAKAFCLPDGRPTRMVGVVTDITEHKRVREELQVLASLVESSEDAIIGQTPDGVVRTWNRGAEAMFGYTADETIGARITLLADSEADDSQDISRILNGERVIHRETIRRRKDGTPIFVSLTISPIRADMGEVIGISEVARDVTARKQAEEEIKNLNEKLELRVQKRTAQLEEANRMLQSFAYTVSHDLRAPLRTIRGLTQALVEDCGEMLDTSGRDYAARIVDCASRMDALIRDLLEYSRVSRAEMSVEPLSLTAAVAKAIEMQKADTEGFQEAGMPEPDIQMMNPLHDVIGHQSTIIQMLANLLGNAIKFVAPGTRPVVRIRSELRGPRVRVWVEDNGIGIDPLHHARIFEVFERLHGTADFPGTGIGLAIVRKGAERLGGDVGLESSYGAGSRFWFELKRVP
jgi:PAS domain S-box-containing protein